MTNQDLYKLILDFNKNFDFFTIAVFCDVCMSADSFHKKIASDWHSSF